MAKSRFMDLESSTALSLVHVKDVASAFVDTLEAPRFMRNNQIFHVGDKRNNKTVNEIAEVVKSQLPQTNIHHKEKATDRRDYSINCNKLKNIIGWKPQWSVEDGIKDLLDKLKTYDWDWEADKYRNSTYEYV